MKNQKFEINAAANVGKIRNHNKDNFFINNFSLTFEQANNGYSFDKAVATPFVAGISDGMGGEKLGEEASAIISSCLYEFINKYQSPLSNSGIKECIKKINDKVCNDAPKSGATLAMIYVYDQKITAVSIGDSRIYIYSNNKLKQISKDHTLAQFQVDAGILTPEAAKNQIYATG